MQCVVIAENDISEWKDNTGVIYHYPKRYKNLLREGSLLIHYKGRVTPLSKAASRLSQDPHYFAVSIAGESKEDPDSDKGDLFLSITEFKPFERPVPIRIEGLTLEYIPENRKTNYWRDGVRKGSIDLYRKILEISGLVEFPPFVEGDIDVDNDIYTSEYEGGKRLIYTSRYERSPTLRAKALEIHGTTCAACETTLSTVYGEIASGYIQIHHKRPLHIEGGPVLIDPAQDLIPLCPNCHVMVHRQKSLLSVNELRNHLGKKPIPNGW